MSGRQLFNDPVTNLFFKVAFTNLGTSSQDEAMCHQVSWADQSFKSYSFREAGNLYPITFPIKGSQPIITFQFFVTKSNAITEWIKEVATYIRQYGPLNLLKTGHQTALDCSIFQYADDNFETEPIRKINLFRCLPESHTPFQTLNTMGNALATEKLSLYYFDYEIEE